MKIELAENIAVVWPSGVVDIAVAIEVGTGLRPTLIDESGKVIDIGSSQARPTLKRWADRRTWEDETGLGRVWTSGGRVWMAARGSDPVDIGPDDPDTIREATWGMTERRERRLVPA